MLVLDCFPLGPNLPAGSDLLPETWISPIGLEWEAPWNRGVVENPRIERKIHGNLLVIG
jgi:hypothetical protein